MIFCREDQGQVEFAALEQLENPDHHADSVRTMNMYIRIREMLGLVDCPLKFSLKDLLRPQGDRTEIFLSAILNFCLHKYVSLTYFALINCLQFLLFWETGNNLEIYAIS